MERASLVNNSRDLEVMRKDSKLSLYKEHPSKLFQSEKHYSSKILKP